MQYIGAKESPLISFQGVIGKLKKVAVERKQIRSLLLLHFPCS